MKLKVLAGLAVLMLAGRPAHGSYPGSEEKVVAAVKRIRPSVVYIVTNREDGHLPAIGSGLVFSSDGVILTNNHVVRRAQTIRVYLNSGTHYSARILAASSAHDLALLKIDATGLSPVRFGDSDRLEPGQLAISMGSPMKFRFSVSVGCISGLQRQQQTREVRFDDLIQTDAAINPGSSGGPLLNSNGEVIGINTLVYTGDPQYPQVHPYGIAFAIPSNIAKRVAQDLMARKPADSDLHPVLGVDGHTLGSDEAENLGLNIRSGVFVESIQPETPAASAGMKPKDIISKVNGKVVRSIDELKTMIDAMKADETVELGVWRGGKLMLIKVHLEASTKGDT
ncbi:MAG TPA: trypsin-like peptidase domain-containing protein [Candidatus Xenobia bacterium]